MSHENVELVREAYDKFARKEIPAIFELFDDQIEFYQSELLPWGGRYIGVHEVRQFFTKLLQHIDSIVEPMEIVEAGDHVVVIARLHGKVQLHAKPFDMTAVHVWTMKHRKAVRFEVYIDTPRMLQALEKE